jgi:hypothetical protein
MIEITNRLFQPLTLQASTGVGVHLPPRGRVTVAEADVSEAMRRAAQRGFILLQPLEAPVAPTPPEAQGIDHPASEPPTRRHARKEG